MPLWAWQEDITEGALTCAVGETGDKEYFCAQTNSTFRLSCKGKKASQPYTCGSRDASLCTFWDGEAPSSPSPDCRIGAAAGARDWCT
jgi:hypothetical protein